MDGGEGGGEESERGRGGVPSLGASDEGCRERRGSGDEEDERVTDGGEGGM